jgi:hypothetical protein
MGGAVGEGRGCGSHEGGWLASVWSSQRYDGPESMLHRTPRAAATTGDTRAAVRRQLMALLGRVGG